MQVRSFKVKLYLNNYKLSTEIFTVTFLNNIPIILFIQKHNGEGFDFYFMGRVKPLENANSFKLSKVGDTKHSVVVIQFELDYPVEIDMYNYLIKEIKVADGV